MLNKSIDRATPFERGQEQAEAMLGMQKELLEVCEQASRAWLDRVKSEVDLWTELAAKLSSTRSLPDALGTYQECGTQRMQMAAEDGRRMADECQRFLQEIRPPAAQRVADRQDLSAFSILPNTRCIAFVQGGQTIQQGLQSPH